MRIVRRVHIVCLAAACSPAVTGTPDDQRDWLAPDLPVTLTAANDFAGHDPVLEAALAANAALQP